jgi:probable HAF family extracellular repeat protein
MSSRIRAARSAVPLLIAAGSACSPDAVTATMASPLPTEATANLVMNPSAWDLTLLPLLPGGTWSEAHAVNDSGVVVGFGNVADGSTHAFKYRNGVITDLGTSKSYSATYARGVNIAGEVVGSAMEPGKGPNRPVAVRWSAAGAIAALPGTATALASEAYDINSLGVTVGHSQLRTGFWRATKWKNGVMIDMDLAAAATSSAAPTRMSAAGYPGGSTALAINDAELSAGYEWGENPVAWEDAVAWEATNNKHWPSPDGGNSRATAVNAAGQLFGWVEYLYGGPGSIYWIGDVYTLGDVYAGWPSATGWQRWPEPHAKVALSDRKRIAGTLTSGGFTQAWTGRYATNDMTMLKSTPPYAISRAVDVNTCGWVIGHVAQPLGGPRRAALWRGYILTRNGKIYVCDPPV